MEDLAGGGFDDAAHAVCVSGIGQLVAEFPVGVALEVLAYEELVAPGEAEGFPAEVEGAEEGWHCCCGWW